MLCTCNRSNSQIKMMEINASEVIYKNDDIAVLHVHKQNKTVNWKKNSDIASPVAEKASTLTDASKEPNAKITPCSLDKLSTDNDAAVQVAKSDVFMNIYDNAQGLSDFVISTPTKKFPVHKEVLMVHSDKFYKLFTSPSDKSGEETPKEILLENVSDDVIEKHVMKFLYTGKIQFDPDNVTDILHTSTQLHLKKLKEAGLQFVKNYTTDNVLPLIAVCKENRMKSLQREMTEFLYQNFPAVMLTDSFSKLDAKAVTRLLESYELRIHGETKILEAAILWCNNNPDQIASSAEQLFDSIHFYCISPKDICDYLSMNSDVLQHGGCKGKIMNAYRYHAIQHHTNKIVALNGASATREDVMDGRLILAIGGTSFSIDIENSKPSSCAMMAICLDDENSTISSKWLEYATLPVPSSFHCAVLVDEALYLLGGSDVRQYDCFKPEPSRRVFRFQPTDRQWIETCPMLTERMCFASVVSGGHIFVFGGLGGQQKVLNACERYSPQQDKWTSIEPMVYERAGLCAASLSTEHILIIGGYTFNHCRKDLITYVEQYDVLQNRWSQKKPRMSGIACASLLQVNGHLYLIGGAQFDDFTVDLASRDSIETYMLQHDCWITIAALSVPRMAMGTTLVGDKIYIFGGLCTQCHSVLTSVECFDASLSTVIPSDLMNLPQGVLGLQGAFFLQKSLL